MKVFALDMKLFPPEMEDGGQTFINKKVNHATGKFVCDSSHFNSSPREQLYENRSKHSIDISTTTILSIQTYRFQLTLSVYHCPKFPVTFAIVYGSKNCFCSSAIHLAPYVHNYHKETLISNATSM